MNFSVAVVKRKVTNKWRIIYVSGKNGCEVVAIVGLAARACVPTSSAAEQNKLSNAFYFFKWYNNKPYPTPAASVVLAV